MRVSRVFVGWIGSWLMMAITTSVFAQPPLPEVTKEHKMLKKDIGNWDAEMRVWPAGPDSEPMVSKAQERNRMLGDLWVISDFTADFAGQAFEGHAQMGYDPTKKKFVGTWVDTTATTIGLMEGTYDEAAREMTLFSTGTDPATGAKVTSKAVTKYTTEDTRLFTMYMKSPEGKWIKSMEIVYTRCTTK